MKRIFSALLSLVMILSLVAAMGITASAADLYDSAKDGDVLYTVNFKGDDAFAPTQFRVVAENALEVAVSDDGSSFTANYVSTTKGHAFWGGQIKGLTYGPDKTYTITMKMAIASYDDNGTRKSNNAGVFVNFPTNTDAEYVKETGYKTLIGYYGAPDVQHSLSHAAGTKVMGKYASNYDYSKFNLATLDAEGFVDIAFVIDGKTMTVYINNVYYDEVDSFTTDFYKNGSNLGFSTYLYNTNASITVKDAKVYKGNIVKDPTYPDYYKGNTGSEITNYDSTKTGDLLFTADFSRADAGFNPRVQRASNNYNITTDKGYIKFESIGGNSACWYGSAVSGLEVNAETRYTYDWKVKSNAKNSGLVFAVPANDLVSNGYNMYGNFSTGSICTEYSSTKIVNINDPGKDYVNVSDMAVDADGYANMRVELHGYKATVYYLNTAGAWTNYNEFDMRETQKFDGSATYTCPDGLQIAVGFYVYNKDMSAEYKDINIYKGLLISDPEGKLDPVITEPEVPADPVPTGDSALIFAVVAIISVLGVATIAKRREN
ncbi:MAG: hypothetical protein IKK01_06850 [Clostridia bacterium]|nr:hypothetical protein [Clostridia bacterium]